MKKIILMLMLIICSVNIISAIDYNNISFTNEEFYNGAITNSKVIELSTGKLAVGYIVSGGAFYVTTCDLDGTNCLTPKFITNSGGTGSINILDDGTQMIVILGASTGIYKTLSYDLSSISGNFIFNSGSTAYVSAVQTSSTEFAIAFQDTADSNKGKVIICKLDGSSCGSEIDINMAGLSYTKMLLTSNNKIVIGGYRSDTNSFQIRFYTTTGTYIRVININSGQTSYIDMIEGSDNKLKIVYRDEGNSNYGTFRSCDLDGTNCGSEIVFANYISSYFNIEEVEKEKLVISFQDNSASPYGGKLLFMNLDGSEITSESIIQNSVIMNNIDMLYSTDKKLIFSVNEQTNSKGMFAISESFSSTPAINNDIQEYYNINNISIQLSNDWQSSADLNEDLNFNDFTTNNLEVSGENIQLKKNNIIEDISFTGLTNYNSYKEFGVKIYANKNVKLTYINTCTGSTPATKAYLKDHNQNIISTVDITNSKATFDYDLIAGNTYFIITDRSNSNHDTCYKNINFPINNNHLNIIAGFTNDAERNNQIGAITNINTVEISNNHLTSGYLEKSFTTSKTYNKFMITESKVLNQQTINTKLLYNGQEYTFTNSILNLNVPSGSIITLKYEFSTNDVSITPQLSNNINLRATNTNEIPQVQMSYILDGQEEINLGNTTFTNINLNSLSEGLHNIILISTAEEQKNTSINFTIDTTNPIITNNSIPLEINSYDLTDINITIEELNQDSCLILWDDSTNQTCDVTTKTFATNGYHNYSIKITDKAGNSITQDYNILINPYQYFRFYDNVRSLYVTNFTFGNYNSSDNYIKIPIYDLGLNNHNLEFIKSGYDSKKYNFDFNSTSNLNLTFNVTPITLTIKVYDEESPTTQLKFNLTIENGINSTSYLNQLNFQKYYNEILNGNLTLTIENKNYGIRKLYIDLSPHSTSSNIIYLLKTDKVTPVIFRTLNSAGTTAIENVVINFYKLLNGKKEFIGQAKTDSQGYTFFNLDYIGDYKIVFTKAGYVVTTINSIPGRTEYPILMSETTSSNKWIFNGFSYSFSPKNEIIETLPFNISVNVIDEYNLISKTELIIKYNNITKILTSINANGDILKTLITDNASRYDVTLNIIREGQTYSFTKSYNYINPTNSTASLKFAKEQIKDSKYNLSKGILMIFIYIGVVGACSMYGPIVGAFAGIFPLSLFVYFDWLSGGIATLLGAFTILGGLYFQQ